MTSADFRVTHQGLGQRSLDNLQRTLARLQRTQDQVSSMRFLNRPSDSPIGAASSLHIRADLGRGEQIDRNIDDAMAWLGTADSTLSEVVDQVIRARDLAVQGRNASQDQQSRNALALEVDKIRDTLIGLANTKYLDRGLFAGTAAGNSYDSTGVFLGNSVAVKRSVASGVQVQVNVTGDGVFGATGTDLFTVLADIADSLRTDPTALDADVTNLDTRMASIKDAVAEIGSRMRRVETMRDRNDSGALTLKKSLSEVEDVDVPKAIMELQMQEMAYQAALQVTARAMQPSLLDFLR